MSKSSLSPNNPSPLDVAVIGAGGMGRTVVDHLLASKGVRTIFVQDVDQDKLAACPVAPNVCPTLDLEAVLQNPEIQLLFIATPNFTHKDLTLRALAAGKAVLCEKPMATSLADAEAMVVEAERHQAFLQIGFELRYSRLFTIIKDWIEQGHLGRIVNTNCQYFCCEYAGPNSWRVKTSSGGGMFPEKLSHYVDLPRWWIGDTVTSVYSACAPNVIPYYEIRDNFHTTYRFAQGAVSHLSFGMGVASTFRGDPLQNAVSLQKNDGHTLKYLLTGTSGAATADVFARSIKRWKFSWEDGRHECEAVEELSWPETEDHAYLHNTAEQTRDVVERVRLGQPPKTPARDALETMRLSLAAEESADSGEVIRLG